jgi:hypothetical protein
MSITVEQAIESIKREYNNALAPKVEEKEVIELIQNQEKKIEELKGALNLIASISNDHAIIRIAIKQMQ